MTSEWRDHVEHDESHFKKWGCTAIGSLTKCGQQAPFFFQRFLELLRCSWERQRFLWRGFIWWIFRGGALASRFLGFVRRVEYS